jgi:simple sugar transport system ATP-binding protein
MLLSQQKAPFVRHGMINFKHTIQAASDIIGRFRVKASGPAAAARSLSGGNLQKFIVGREIMRHPECSSSHNRRGAWMSALPPRFTVKYVS